MPRRDPLTPEQKWQAATRFVNAFPILYDVTFRERIGEDYDALEQQIWVHLAGIARNFAFAAGLPAGDAEEIMATLGTILSALVGPEFRAEEIPIDRGRAVLMVKRCPFVFREAEVRDAPANLLSRCLAFSIALVEALNPGYTLRFVRCMCMGDKTCELKIMTREDAEKEDSRGVSVIRG